MAPQINWALLQPVDVGATIRQGYEHGRQMRQEREYQNALGAWAQNPDDPVAVASIMRAKPEVGYRIYGDIQERQAARVKAEEAKRAELVKTVGHLAKGAKDAATWDASVDFLVSNGVPEAAGYKGKFSPEMRSAAMAQAGVDDAGETDPAQVKFFNWLKVNKPELAEPYIRGAADPTIIVPLDNGQRQVYRRSDFLGPSGGGVPTISNPEEARRLPPGSQFYAPDGSLRTVPGGPSPSGSAGFP